MAMPWKYWWKNLKKKTPNYKKQKIKTSWPRIFGAAILLLILFILLLWLSNIIQGPKTEINPNPSMPEGLVPAEVVWVSDGDTIVCRIEGGLPEEIAAIVGEVEGDAEKNEYYIRLIGIDAPESVHPDPEKNTEEGRLSSEYVKNNLEGQKVNLEFDTQYKDKYNRLLAYVWLNGELFNKKIIEEGHAELLDIPPNTKYREVFEAAYPKNEQ